jgi:predicted transcriptional regulator
MRAFLAVLILAVILGGEAAGAEPEPLKTPPPGRSVEFTLTDQHAKERSWKFPTAKASVLVVADQKGSEQIEPWVAPLYKRFETKIDIAGVAALPGIPSAFHGLFRREFRKRLMYPVLLDWKGDVSKKFGAKPAIANLYVISQDGKIVKEKTGAMTEKDLKEVIAALDQLLQ